MSARTPFQSRVNLRLDPQHDADLIAWLESFPSGQRSAAIRAALRQALDADKGHPIRRDSVFDLEVFRVVVAEEIGKALGTRQLSLESHPIQVVEDDVETRFGSKLDQMMGGLIQKQDGKD